MRIILYLAADRKPNIERLTATPPDGFIVDLEESVADENAVMAREGIADLIEMLRPLDRPIAVRINGLDQEKGRDDLKAVDQLPEDIAVVIPKPITPELLAHLRINREFWLMGEEAGFEDDVAGYASSDPSLTTIIIGIKDLAESLHVPLQPDAEDLRAAACAIKTASHAAGLQVIDGVAFGDEVQIGAAVQRAKSDGFNGITCMLSRDIATIGSA